MKVLSLLLAVPLAVRAQNFWIGAANCDTVDWCEGCEPSWSFYVFASENQPGCSEWYDGRPGDSWEWDDSYHPSKMTQILCDKYIDFYWTGSAYDYYFSGGDGTKLGTCYQNDASVAGPCIWGGGSCGVRGVMYCYSDQQIC